MDIIGVQKRYTLKAEGEIIQIAFSSFKKALGDAEKARKTGLNNLSILDMDGLEIPYSVKK